MEWNNKSKLLDRSHSVSGVQDYFEDIIKEHETVTDNPTVRRYVH